MDIFDTFMCCVQYFESLAMLCNKEVCLLCLCLPLWVIHTVIYNSEEHKSIDSVQRRSTSFLFTTSMDYLEMHSRLTTSDSDSMRHKFFMHAQHYILQGLACDAIVGTALVPLAIPLQGVPKNHFGNMLQLQSTPLAYAIKAPSREGGDIAYLVLSLGARVEGLSSDTYTPLMCAVITNNIYVAKVLLEFGASPYRKTKTGQSLSAQDIAILLDNKPMIQLIDKYSNHCKIAHDEISALSLAMHPRLGEQSAAHKVNADILQNILTILRSSYQADPLPEGDHLTLMEKLRQPEQRQLHEVGQRNYGFFPLLRSLATYIPGCTTAATTLGSVASMAGKCIPWQH